MKEVKKMEYFAPQVEVLNARVEKGFQMSGDPMATGNGTSETLGNSGEVHGGDDFDQSLTRNKSKKNQVVKEKSKNQERK